MDAQSANADLTIDTGAQTVDRTLAVPVLTGNRTLAVIDQAQTFTAAQTISATTGLTMSAASGTSVSVSSTQASSGGGGATDGCAYFAGGVSFGAGGVGLSVKDNAALRTGDATGAGNFYMDVSILNVRRGDSVGSGRVNAGVLNITSVTAATTTTAGPVVIGDGTAAGSTAIGLGSIFTAGNITATSTTNTRYFTVNGIGSGASGGAAFIVQGGSTNVMAFGSKSAIIGGAYDATPYLTAGPTATSTLELAGGFSVTLRSSLGTIGTTFAGNTIAGVQDGTADTAGAVGEVTQGTNQTTYTNFTTTNTYQQLAVLTSLPRGRYRVVGTVTYYGNGATVAAIADATFAISTTTASASGAVEGRSLGYITQPVTSSTHITVSIDTDINISAATSYYLNGKANFTVGNPQWVASITAYRLR